MDEFYLDRLTEESIQLNPSIYHIKINNLTLSVYFKPKNNSQKLYVFSPGYLNRTKFQHPYFQRMKWLDELDGSGIIITDPTFSTSDVGIAWFQGSSERFALFDIAKVIEVFQKKLLINNSRTVFFGSSAGGFGSLILATIFKESRCIVNNPQTDVFSFDKKHVDNMIEACYPNLSIDEIKSRYYKRLSVSKFIEACGYIPKCLYIQNFADIEHYKLHFQPFFNDLHQAYQSMPELNLSNISIRLYDDKDSGHNPAVLSFLKPYFNMIEELL